jgi:hypothetical protein
MPLLAMPLKTLLRHSRESGNAFGRSKSTWISRFRGNDTRILGRVDQAQRIHQIP